WNLRPFLERLLRSPRIVPILIMNEAQCEIQPPVLRVGANAFLHKGSCLVRLAGAPRRPLRQEDRSALISGDKVRVKIRCDVKQRIEQVVALGSLQLPAAKILDRAGPINICQKIGIPQAQTLERLTRRQIEDLLQRRFCSAERLCFARGENRSCEKHHQEQRRNDNYCAMTL